jgi:hypothetical protein
MQAATNERVKGRGKHPFGKVRRPVPIYSNDYNTPLQNIANALGIKSDPELASLLGAKANRGTIREWRRGNRRTPLWAIEKLELEWQRQWERLETGRYWFAQAKKDPP